MTGYGKAEVQYNGKVISIEVKSLNSKQLDLNVKLPFIYRDKEFEIRNRVSNKLIRGKIDFYINIDEKKETTAVPINTGVFKSYFEQIKDLSKDINLDISAEPIIQSILRLPDVLKVERINVSDEEWEKVFRGIDEALDSLYQFRIQEGEALRKDISERVMLIEALLQQVEPFEKLRLDNIKTRIADGLSGLKNDIKIDNERFEQELIYYLEKLDITEEKVRLKNHCKYFIETLNEDHPVGRKLGFISQELGREINTIGSKANQIDIQKIVVLMKDELEKIKEQGMNVL